VLLVTHDRYFLDQVATTILAFDTREARPGVSRGVIPFASLGQWEAWREEVAAAERTATAAATATSSTEAPAAPSGGRKKLGYKDQREYDGIEEALARAEAALQETRAESERPENASDHAKLVALLAAVDEGQAEVDRLYARWAELEAKLAGG